jgi:hypothetical protein
MSALDKQCCLVVGLVWLLVWSGFRFGLVWFSIWSGFWSGLVFDLVWVLVWLDESVSDPDM